MVIRSIVLATYLMTIDAEAAPVFPSENCIITTVTEYKDGEKRSKTNSFYFKQKAKCLRTRKLLSENFSPREIKKVTSKMDWRGK